MSISFQVNFVARIMLGTPASGKRKAASLVTSASKKGSGAVPEMLGTPASGKRKAASLITSASKKGSSGSLIKGAFGAAIGAIPPERVHTLILGTQPSDVSLDGQRYYDTHTNALWHIVGDALGFRRGWLDSKGRAPPESITRTLLHERTLDTYDEALITLTGRGYALWDVLRESERAGSLDSDIKNAQPADVRGLVERYPSIERICLASGASTASFFKKHFRAWLEEDGAFRVATGVCAACVQLPLPSLS
jgi:G:T/U-mismatch repair DNA glycosylase